jgi:heme A synthase
VLLGESYLTLTNAAIAATVLVVCMWTFFGFQEVAMFRDINMSPKRKLTNLFITLCVLSVMTGLLAGILCFAYASATYIQPPLPRPPAPPVCSTVE